MLSLLEVILVLFYQDFHKTYNKNYCCVSLTLLTQVSAIKMGTTSSSSASGLPISAFPNLASQLLGSTVVFATDEWFAACDNMIHDNDPVWKADLYTDYGTLVLGFFFKILTRTLYKLSQENGWMVGSQDVVEQRDTIGVS